MNFPKLMKTKILFKKNNKIKTFVNLSQNIQDCEETEMARKENYFSDIFLSQTTATLTHCLSCQLNSFYYR